MNAPVPGKSAEMYAPSPGIKSTEFWAFILMVLVVIINGTKWVNIDPQQLTWLITVGGGYIGVRGWNKHSMARASADMARTGQPANSEPLKPQG